MTIQHTEIQVYVMIRAILGIMIDEKLSWEPHIEHLVSKLNMKIVMLKRITKFIPKSEYRKLYDALFKSHY